MYDVYAHSSLPTLAILALGLLEKKEDDEKFCVGSDEWWKCSLEYLALHKCVSAVLKVCINVDTTVEKAYIVKLAWKFDTVKKNRCFRRDCLWDAILWN